MIYIVRINEKEYEVEVEQGTATLVSTKVLTQTQTDSSLGNTNRTEVIEPYTPSSSKKISSPLPGTVLSIHVTEGQPIKLGDPLLTLEAMKMENEITASENGIIKKILVAKGSTVATNDVLIYFD